MLLNSTLLLYALIGVTGVAIILLVWLIRLEVRMSRLLRGKNAKTLEDSLMTILGELKEVKVFTKDMEEYLTNVESRLKNSIQGVETVRFNPFKGTGSGGNQSFSATFVNEKGNGVVLTSMYARDRISMFAKPLKNFASEFELTEEEQESIEKSKKALITERSV